MKIRTRVHLCGPGYALEPGEETDRFSDADAIRFINAGFAVPLGPVPREQTVATPAPEQRHQPFGGKGDHDGDGRVGGARKPNPRSIG